MILHARFHSGFKAAAVVENLTNNPIIKVTRALKFLKFCCDENGATEEDMMNCPNLIDYVLGSPQLLTNFVDSLKDK